MRFATRKQQAGAALLVSLMILLVISIIGVTAMKTSMFNSKIATSSQGSNMAFMAAETAVDATMNELLAGTDMLDSLIVNASAATFTPVYRCMTGDASHKRDCGPADSMDQRGLVQASSRSVMTGMAGMSSSGGATQISQTGGGSVVFADYTFMVGGVGQVPVLNVSQYVIQEFSKVGLYAGGG